MAQYKVPQDVEAEDKLLGPFSFRQFIYLMIAGGFTASAFALFQVFPLLALLPLPVIVIFGVLALPLRKDQPMETYLAALINFHLKPKVRFWIPGQRESTILITAPKIVERQLTKDISEEEASRRLSFLAEVADTEGRSIKNPSSIREEFVAEANAINDMFSSIPPKHVDEQIATEAVEQRAEAVEKMRDAIQETAAEETIIEEAPAEETIIEETAEDETFDHPDAIIDRPAKTKKHIHDSIKEAEIGSPEAEQPVEPLPPEPSPPPQISPLSQKLMDLTSVPEFTVATIQKEANRLIDEQENEVYISLH